MQLPDALIETLRDVHDDAGPWLAALDETLAELSSRWKLRILGLPPQLSYHLVLYAERDDGAPCVLKLSPPSEELAREAEALTRYAGDGMCRLLARADGVGDGLGDSVGNNAGALLLERVLPGVSLQETWTPEADAEHTRIAALLLRRLWRPVAEPHPFRTLRSWARALWNDAPEVPTALRDAAQERLSALDEGERTLLHADLHHGNILSAGPGDYRAIDPKGIVGPRGYDAATFLLNPPQADAATILGLLPGRLQTFSDVLGIPASQLAAWGFVHAFLSACWSAEDHGTRDERALVVAEGMLDRGAPHP